MAGIWDTWTDEGGVVVRSFSIITTTANSLVGEIHHRMPVILDRENESLWLSDSDKEDLVELLKPFPGEKMKVYAISRDVNKAGYDHPDLHLPS